MQRHMLFNLRNSTLPISPEPATSDPSLPPAMLPLSATATEKHLGWGSSYHPSRAGEASRECTAETHVLIEHWFTLRWAKLTQARLFMAKQLGKWSALGS